MRHEILHVFHSDKHPLEGYSMSDYFEENEERSVLIDGEAYVEKPIPGIEPLRALVSGNMSGPYRFCYVGFEESIIGQVDIKHQYDNPGNYSVEAVIKDIVPERLMPSIAHRLRTVVAAINDYKVDREIAYQRAEDNLMEIMGPIDSQRVKVNTEIPERELITLTFPGMIDHIIGPGFSMSTDVASNNRERVMISSYQENGVKIPAFRIAVKKDWREINQNGRIEIWGRGNRERARENFVRELIISSIKARENLVGNQDFKEACENLPPTVIDSKNVRNALYAYYSVDNEESNLGEYQVNEQIVVRMMRRKNRQPNSHWRDFLVLYEGCPVLHSSHGHLPGMDEEQMRRIHQAGFMTACENDEVFLSHNRAVYESVIKALDDMGVNTHNREETIENRMLNAFGF